MKLHELITNDLINLVTYSFQVNIRIFTAEVQIY